MKRKLLYYKSLKQAALAVPAAALMLGASQAAQVGINFQDNWGGVPYAPLTDTSAFGIPLASWLNAPSVTDSGSTPISTSAIFSVPGGGDLRIAWSCKNTYSLYAAIPTSPGEDQVIYGYLDDSDYGYTVTISGWRAFASSFSVTTIASSDNATGFQDANIYSKTETNTVQYLNNYIPSFAAGLAGTSTVSSAFVTLSGNDSITIRGVARNGTSRSCLAGILLNFTPSTANPPLIEANPQTPAGTLFPGSSFVLSAQASGATPLSYQWRKGGAEIPGATYASYTNASAVVGDSGSYDVVVTNPNGNATSTAVQVTIQDVTTPVIAKGPASQSFYQGYPVTFSVEATGGQLAYQWKKGTTAIAGATTSSYTISSIVAADQDTYTVTVSNPIGTIDASATLTVTIPASAYESAVVNTKPLLWFRNSDATAPVQDVAANSGSLGAAGSGLFIGAALHPVPGALAGNSDTAASFSGGRVSVPYASGLNPDTFTIEAWLKPAAELSGTTLTCPLSSVHIADPRAGWLIYQSPTGWNLRTYNQNSTTVALSITAGPAPVSNQWYHVVATWDGTVGRVYVNGALSATSGPTNYVANADGAFAVGARSDGAFAWAGTADEVAHYSVALSGAQVLAHYQNGTNASRTTPYETLITTDGAVEYLRLNQPAFGGTPVNVGTLGAAWNGTYSDAGGILGDPQIAVGQVGPRPPGQPGLESDNRAILVTNGFVSAPICTNLNGNTVTFAGWIKPEEIPSASDLGWPCWFGQGGMHIENSANRPTRELRYHWTGDHWAWGSGLVAPANVWTFVALVVEPTKATIYMSDGSTLKSAVNTRAHDAISVSSPVSFGGNQPGRADRTYRGGLDETTVYNRALTQSEINSLFMAGTGAKLQLTLSNGGIIEDTKPSGTLHHGVNTSVSTAWVASSTDAAAPAVTRTGVAQFATTNQSQITIPADADFNSTVGTFSFWIRANAPIPGPGAEAAILVDRRDSWGGDGVVIAINDAGSIFVQTSDNVNMFSGGYVPDDLWHHVAVTYDQAANGLMAIYVDGFIMGSQANSAAWAWPTGQQIELGRSHDGYWKRFDGQMDDFRIYNRVLTEAEIASIKASDAIVDASALKVRYNFTTTGIGKTVSWPFGTLQSSPVLGPDANWTPVPGAVAPNYPFLPTDPQLYFRAIP